MCTVSLIPVGAGWRLMCNRDEHRERSAARPPRKNALPSGRRAWWPVDTHAGGTWIAGADHGLVLCVMNLMPEGAASVVDVPGLRSRGLLIPDLIGLGSPGEVARAASALDFTRYAPLRLLAMDLSGPGSGIAEVRWDRREAGTVWHAQREACFVSSGLGDAKAGPRLDLFEQMVVAGGATPERQDEFHRHTWPEHPEISVMMSRAEARTVSITTIEAGGGRVSMGYEPVAARPVAVR